MAVLTRKLQHLRHFLHLAHQAAANGASTALSAMTCMPAALAGHVPVFWRYWNASADAPGWLYVACTRWLMA